MADNAEWIWGPQEPLSKKSNGPLNIETLTPRVSRYVRESGQNSVDARRDPDPEIHYRLIRVSGGDLTAFLDAFDWSGYAQHVRKFAERIGPDGRKLIAALDDVEAGGDLVLARVEDLGMVGLTGPEFRELDDAVDSVEEDRHFSSLLMEDLATKSDEKTGGSWGIGKALYFGMSRLYTAMVNTTLHPDHPLDGATHGRIFGRTEMGWHQVEGKTYSGQGFFGLREKTAEGDLARSSWGDGDLARALFLDRASDRPGTSILTLAFHDPESPEATLTDLQSGIEQAWREHFWPLLVRQRVAVTISTADGHDLRADPIRLDRENLDSDLVELLDRYDQGEALSAPGDTGMSSGTVVSVPIPVLVPPRRDGSEESFTHECQLVVRATDRTGGPPRNRVSYVRGPEMVVRSDDQSGLDPATFDAILLAGKAVLPLGVPITADIERAEAYFRSSEPPAHDEWGSGRKLAERYSGTFRKPLHDLPTQVSKALWDLFEQVATESEDAPKELRDLLRIGTDVKDPKPQVVSLTGAVDGDRWDVTFNIRVTDRPEGWWLEPRIAQVGETSARSALEWDDPLESDRGVVVGHRITLPTRGTGRAYSFSVTGRTKPVAADAEHRREQLPAGRSVIAVDIARSGRPTSGGEA